MWVGATGGRPDLVGAWGWGIRGFIWYFRGALVILPQRGNIYTAQGNRPGF